MTDQTAAIEVWARVLCAADAHVHGYPTWQQLPTAPGPSGRSQDDYRKVAAWLLPRMTVADPAEQAPATEERAARWETAALKAGREVDRNALRVYMAVADDEQAELRRMADEAQQDEAHPPYDSWLVELQMDDGHWAVAYPTHDYDKALDRLTRRRTEHPDQQWRLVRETDTFTVVDPKPAVEAQQPKEARS